MQKIWRLSHLWLSIISFSFLLLAAITGAILAIEPINEYKNIDSNSSQISDISLIETISYLKENYDEVFEVKVDEHDRVIVSLLNFDPELDGEFYFNPKTKKLTEIGSNKRNKFFEWTQSLHRSLFLESTGRNIMAVIAAILTLIVVSGIGLIIQRQQSFKKFYSKIVSSHFLQFSHVWLGRIFLFPLLVVTLSAVILSIERLGWLNSGGVKASTYNYVESIPKDISEFEFIKNKKLSDVRKIEFPFSEDDTDYYRIYFNDKIVNIAQYTGQILSEEDTPKILQAKEYALDLHTGRGNAGWSVILFLSACSILYFVISGGIIYFKKKKINKTDNNLFSKQESEYIILYGSENGSTEEKAKILYNVLINQKHKTYITSLNNVTNFPKMKKLVIITSTYGDGEAPDNANKFIEKIPHYIKGKSLKYSIVGFGAIEYPKFCAFAKSCALAMEDTQAKEITAPVYINHQNINDFKAWLKLWIKKNNLKLDSEDELIYKSKNLHNFTIIEKDMVDDGYSTTFNLWVKLNKYQKFESGDLLAIIPPGSQEQRYYSISKYNDNILISVKLHPNGLCSQYLYNLNIGDQFKGYIKSQPNFHFNTKHKTHTYIANGTGIAPFIGMIMNNKNHHHRVILGFRKHDSFSLYEKILKSLSNVDLHVCFSREERGYHYVQEIVKEIAGELVKELQDDGEILICGSFSMSKDVLNNLEIEFSKSSTYNDESVDYYKSLNKIKIDCY